MPTVSNPPKGCPALTPYLIVKDAARAIDWYAKVLGGVERFRFPAPDGGIGHAELQLGDSLLMLASPYPQMGAESPEHFGGSPVSLLLYVPDSDDAVKRATEEGAELLRPVETQFYGDRSGTLRDPFGHIWTLATHVEDVPEDELARRAQAAHA